MQVEARWVKQKLKAEAEVPLFVVEGGTDELLVVVVDNVEGTDDDVLNPRLSWASGCPPCPDRSTPNIMVDSVDGSEVEDVLSAAISATEFNKQCN